MSTSESRRPPISDRHGLTAVPGDAEYLRCDRCGAPVEELQRYCVACGAHRPHVPDPAARYLSQASARARLARRGVTAAARTRTRRTVGLGTALLIALVPLAGAAGLVVGQSSAGAPVRVAHHETSIGRTGSASAAARLKSGKSASHKALDHVQNSTGSSYVQSQNDLSNSVSVP